MEFYFFIIPTLLFLIYQIFRLRSITKHDKILFGFCQNRREMMKLIRDKNQTLSIEDYQALRELVEMTNKTIHNFNHYKPVLFNFRRFIEYVRNAQEVDNKFKEHQFGSQEIAELYNRFFLTLLGAFFTFTPLIKSEIVLRASIYFFKALAKLGARKAKRVIELLTWVEKEADEHNLSYSLSFPK